VLDITDQRVVVDYDANDPTPASMIRQYILNARGNSATFEATWTGTRGITSSVTAAQADGGIATAVGWAENSDLYFGAYTSFGSEAVDESSILIKYTCGADANLDGNVDGPDLDILSTFTGGTGGWYRGDFNYDGNLDGSDMDELAFTYGATTPPGVRTDNEGGGLRSSMEGEPMTVAERVEAALAYLLDALGERAGSGFEARFRAIVALRTDV
jgi:hypothetical protein